MSSPKAGHSFDVAAFQQWAAANRQRLIDVLCSYIRIPTVSPDEGLAQEFIAKYLANAGFEVSAEPLHPGLATHPAFSPCPTKSSGHIAHNVRARHRNNVPSLRRVLFNAHIDVVPATPNFSRAFEPEVIGDVLFGRGACDTKANLVMAVEATRFLQEVGVALRRNVSIDATVQEEVGGNGTLSTIMNGVDADEVIVLEPTELEMFRGHRGCLSTMISISGRSVHMGSDTTGISAIEVAMDVIRALKHLETELLTRASDDPDFSKWPKPVQVNVGIIKGGEWSGSVPEHCWIWADVGFLPSDSLSQIEQKITSAITPAKTSHKGCDIAVDFYQGLRNDAYILDADDSLVQTFSRCLYGVQSKATFGWKVSCDARHYSKVAHLPTIIFGCGSLDVAHSAEEQVRVSDLFRGILVLARFLSSD